MTKNNIFVVCILFYPNVDFLEECVSQFVWMFTSVC